MRRAQRAGFLLMLGLCAACPRRTGSNEPNAQGDVVQLRYTDRETTLSQSTDLELIQRGGGQYVQASAKLQATVTLVPQGDGLKVVWALEGVDQLELEGDLPRDEGLDQFLLEHGQGAALIDRSGVSASDANATLPENAARQAAMDEESASATDTEEPATIGAGPRLLGLLPTVMALPRLPEDGIKPGEAKVFDEQIEVEFQGIGLVLPTEVAHRYTLVQLDEAGGRIAQLEQESISKGQIELDDGSVTVETRSEARLLFDVDTGLPVSFELNQREEYELPDVEGESTTIVRSEFTRPDRSPAGK